MEISVFGLGYVGCVGAACLAEAGHRVIGVDINQAKVDLLNEGNPTIVEAEIGDVVASQTRAGRLRATTDAVMAVDATEMSMICVGTPMGPQGHPNLEYVLKVALQIGQVLREKSGFHTIAIRSTVPPGTCERVTQVVGDACGGVPGDRFGVASNPEFLREGSAVADFRNPPFTIIGSRSDRAIAQLRSIYEAFNAPIHVADPPVTEMLKYVSNSFHALKVTFANEIGRLCKEMRIDSHCVMELFCKDVELNISPKYLIPGLAYGGSCLPKDLKGLSSLAHKHYVETPVLNAIDTSNEIHKRAVLAAIASTGLKRVGLLGLAFKSGTDDLRSSPSVDLAEALLGKGYQLSIFDRSVQLSKLIGANREYIAERLPHLADLISDDLDEVIAAVDVLVITQRTPEFAAVVAAAGGKRIIDLARVSDDVSEGHYEGLCW